MGTREKHSFSIDPFHFSKCSLGEWNEICEATMNFLNSPNTLLATNFSLGFVPILNVLACDCNRINRRFNVIVEYESNGNDRHWICDFVEWWRIILDSVYSDNHRTKLKYIIDKRCPNFWPNGSDQLQNICERMFSLTKIDSHYSDGVKNECMMNECMIFGCGLKNAILEDYYRFVELKKLAMEKDPSLKENPDKMQYDGWRFVFPKRIRDWILEQYYELDSQNKIVNWSAQKIPRSNVDTYLTIIHPIPKNMNDLRLLTAENPNLKIVDPFEKQ